MSTENTTWEPFLRLYSETNEGRPTRIGVFERREDELTDYWLESGLPLVGIDSDHTNGDRSVQIMVGEMTHTIQDAKRITFHVDAGTGTDGIDVVGSDGRVTILRFEEEGAGE